jgi:hypothetical protein
MPSITKLGKSQNGNEKVAVDIGNIQGTIGVSSKGNPTIRLNGSHFIDGKVYYLTGNLTEKSQ